MTAGKKLLNLLFAPIVIAASIGIVVAMVKARKDPPPRKPPVATPHVSVMMSEPADASPTISTYGNVRTYDAASVASQVSGKIESITPGFDPGRAVEAGDLLAKIEDADYRSILAERESAIAAAKQTLADETTRSQIASEDWVASGRDLAKAPEFTLRKPQLAAAEAALEAAEASADQARLNLERTEIRAPFDAIVQTRDTSPGNIVAPGNILGTLISRNKAEVRLPLTPEQAARLDLPLAFVPASNKSIAATLRNPAKPDQTWQAIVTRTEAAIDAQNQVLYVIAEIPKPFESGKSFLPIGTFVTAELKGAPLSEVHTIPDTALVEDEFVWIVDPDKKLLQQPVERLFSEKGNFLARIDSPLTELPLQIVTRPLASFRSGSVVKIDDAIPDAEKP